MSPDRPHPTEADELAEYHPFIKRMREIGESYGMSYRDIFWRKATQDNLSFVASFGLPNRFSHWYFGGIYKNLKIQQDESLISILELVLNTDPVYAFLLEHNSLLENLMVIAHVYGHVDFFRNNAWYVKSDRNMLNRCEFHARTIRELAATHGQAKVDDMIEASLTIANTVNPFERDPKKKRERLIYFIRDHTRTLASTTKKSDPRHTDLKLAHQVLSMMCLEMEYFDLIGRTQIINEGWASFVEFKILEKVLKPKEWLEFTLQFSKRPAPYLIGFTLFNACFRRGGWPEVLQIRNDYEDIAGAGRHRHHGAEVGRPGATQEPAGARLRLRTYTAARLTVSSARLIIRSRERSRSSPGMALCVWISSETVRMVSALTRCRAARV
ncbi:MAG: SpoVR family protein [Candidatus Riflebacteria bacterium]|nr:SpoVR family protein [Candidatus Riflebacteria bacterium]